CWGRGLGGGGRWRVLPRVTTATLPSSLFMTFSFGNSPVSGGPGPDQARGISEPLALRYLDEHLNKRFLGREQESASQWPWQAGFARLERTYGPQANAEKLESDGEQSTVAE